MNKKEVLSIIRRNKHNERDAIVLLSDFLVISKKEAKQIYNQEFKNQI